MRPISRTLRDIYAHLRSHFGYAPQWWPGSPLEITLTSILVQQCDWSMAWKAIERLRQKELLSLARLAAQDPEVILPYLSSVRFARQKARRLVQLARALCTQGYQDIDTYLAPSRDTTELRQELLHMDGIGKETADCILLFAGKHPCFVVDAYTRRIFQRLAFFPNLDEAYWSQPYDGLQHFFETHLLADLSLYDAFDFAPGVPRPVALFRDYHAQLVELGKHHCRKSKPRCHTIGANGWREYFFCTNHCREEECDCCPLVRRCARQL